MMKCPCGKASYKSTKKAQVHLDSLLRDNEDDRRHLLRIYSCPHSGLFHVGHLSENQL